MENLTTLHWILAYAGALIYVLSKLQENSEIKGYAIGCYVKKNLASTLATIIMIPVCLLIISENFEQTLPINNLTAVLCGWQTNSIFKSLMMMGRKRLGAVEPPPPPTVEVTPPDAT